MNWNAAVRWLDFIEGIVWLELSNAFLFFLTFGMAMILTMMLVQDRAEWRKPYYSLMLGLDAFVMGEAGRQAWYWLWRYLTNSHPSWLDGVEIVALYAHGVIAAIGAACIIRLITVHRYGHRVWVLLMLGAVFGTVATLFLPR